MKAKTKRWNDDQNAGGDASGRGGVSLTPEPTIAEDDLHTLRAIARIGGGRHHVKPKAISISAMRALAQQGYVETLPDLKGGVSAKLTARGLRALAQAPGVFAR